MNALLQNLLKLQSLEFGEGTEKNSGTLIAELRAKIPPPILGHYDRLRVRGKKGVAIVRNQVCSACHIHLPIGVITTIMHDQDIQLCDSCGRYLCLEEKTETAELPRDDSAAVKPAKKPRKRKTLQEA